MDRVVIECEKKLKKELQMYCLVKGITMKEFITMLIKEKINEN